MYKLAAMMFYQRGDEDKFPDEDSNPSQLEDWEVRLDTAVQYINWVMHFAYPSPCGHWMCGSVH